MPSSRPHIILIDGPSGAGKTQLALTMGESLGATVVHVDDVYPGWSGLAAGRDAVIRGVLDKVAVGLPGRVRRWDWHHDRPGGEIDVEPAEVVIIEGCGISTPESRAVADCVVWVECPEGIRNLRLSQRDGQEFDQFRDEWLAQEHRHLIDNDPKNTASVTFHSS